MACCDGQQIGRVEACRSHAHVGVSGTAVRGVDVAGARIQTEAHVGAGDAHAAGAPRARATQPIPPAIRRAVLRRDGGRCRVPGCRHATFVDVHHLELRANGGSNDVENLITLCSAHHRASHNGELLTAGTTATAVSFAHADGTPYRRVPMPAVAEVRAKAFRALVLMGFHEKEAKGALARVPADPELDLERVVRKALQPVGQP